MAFRVTDAYVLVRACTIGNRAVACWGVRTCELFLCFVAIVRARVYNVDFFVFFVLRYW